jgi:hypothetical protein
VRTPRATLLLLTVGLLVFPGIAAVRPRAILAAGRQTAGSAEQGTVKVSWDTALNVSKTTPTLQVVVNPLLRRGSPIHGPAFQSLRDLGCDYVRYVPWFPYPKLGVPALEPPANGKTSWDFSLIDPMTEDFMNAVKGHSVMMNFSTIPHWMFKTEKPVAYPSNPDEPTWTYNQGTELRDPSLKELGDYFARIVSWYTKGGFTDEFGHRHELGHHYTFDYWEVLNEPDLEHQTTPEQYTERYDAIVSAIRAVDPSIKFVGISVANTAVTARFFEYFLDPKNHKPGIPIDMISYHFYAIPTADQPPEIQQYTFFDQADRFLATVRYIELIRQRLAPETKTTINEIGAISADDLLQGEPGFTFKPIPSTYWSLVSGMYAYLYSELARIGIDIAGESQLVGYPTQFPSVSMVDWDTGKPNARWQLLKLIHDNFGPGDTLVSTQVELTSKQPYVYAQAFLTRNRQRKVLLVNKRNRPFTLTVPGARGQALVLDQTTGANPAVSMPLTGGSVTINGHGVVVLTLE